MARSTAALVARVRDLAQQAGSRASVNDAFIIANGINPRARIVTSAALNASKSSTIPVMAGIQDYVLPTGLVSFLRSSAVLWGPERRAVLYRDNTTIARLTYTGEPEFWTIWDGKFRLGPRISTSGTLYLDARTSAPPCAETTPAASTDELGFELDAEDTTIVGAAADICVMTNELGRAAGYEAMFEKKVALLRQRLAPDDDVPAQFGIRAYSDRLMDWW